MPLLYKLRSKPGGAESGRGDRKPGPYHSLAGLREAKGRSWDRIFTKMGWKSTRTVVSYNQLPFLRRALWLTGGHAGKGKSLSLVFFLTEMEARIYLIVYIEYPGTEFHV